MRDFLRVWGPLILVVVAGLVLALFFVDPPPPKSLTLAGGAEGGAYAQAAQRYAAALEQQKIKTTVLSTAGSVENLAKLKAGEADVAIVQTGLAGNLGADGLRTLGALFYEPLWVFHRSAVDISDLRDVRSRRVAIGPEGSGVRVLAELLLAEAGLKSADYTAIPVAGMAAAEALKRGEADIAIIVSGVTPWITELAADPNVELASMTTAHALSRRHPYLDEVMLYQGVLDPARDLPKRDTLLIAPTAQLVVREGLHPAIQSLLIESAYDQHNGGSLLSEPGAFPTPNIADIQASDEAKRYYKSGPSFLRRYFPYNVANFLERAWVLAIPLLTLLFPVVRAAPPLYRWRVRRRIYVWYQSLRELEMAGRAATTSEQRTEVRARLADLQAETGEVKVPLPYNDDLYRLRSHIRFVAELIDRLSAQDKHARV